FLINWKFFWIGVLALVLVANVSSAAIDDQDVISDRRYRWDSSEQVSDEAPKYLEQADDVEEDDDQDSGSNEDDVSEGSGSDEDGSYYLVSEWYEPIDGKSWEDLENDSDES
ncbi:hypothetical protein KR074_011031, partial [Drosophila pseudoananassae]